MLGTHHCTRQLRVYKAILHCLLYHSENDESLMDVSSEWWRVLQMKTEHCAFLVITRRKIITIRKLHVNARKTGVITKKKSVTERNTTMKIRWCYDNR